MNRYVEVESRVVRHVGPLAVCALAMGWILGSTGVAEAANLRFRGSMEFSAHPYRERALVLNQYNRGDSPFDVARFRFFVDAAPTPKLQILAQFRFDDALPSDFATAGAYLLYEALPEGALFLEAGKIPSPFGAFAERDYAEKSALIGTPLMYFFHSTLLTRVVPANEDELLSVRGGGQVGVAYPSAPAAPFRGAPILYTPCWDLGLILLGSRGDFEYRLGAIAGTPGAPVFNSEETNEIPSIIGRFGWVPRAGLRMGVSGSVGPYLPEGAAGAGDPIDGTVPEGSPPRAIPNGHRVEDYLQGLVGADFEAGRGHWTLWAEAVHNRFESPWIRSDLTQNAFYVEIQRLLLPGVDAAVRWDQIRPGKIRNSSGAEVRWDLPVQRLEIGTAYHLSREFQIKVNLQMTGYGLDASSIGDEVLPSMQLVGRF